MSQSIYYETEFHSKRLVHDGQIYVVVLGLVEQADTWNVALMTHAVQTISDAKLKDAHYNNINVILRGAATVENSESRRSKYHLELKIE